MTEAGRQHVISSEGIRLTAYVDEAGLLTIGIGHLITADELKTGMIQIGSELVEYSKGLTNEQAFTLLDQDINSREAELMACIRVPLTPHQRDALVSFAYNIGLSAFKASTLLRLLNLGDYDAVPGQMRRWNKVRIKGDLVASTGLAARREREILLWNEA